MKLGSIAFYRILVEFIEQSTIKSDEGVILITAKNYSYLLFFEYHIISIYFSFLSIE